MAPVNLLPLPLCDSFLISEPVSVLSVLFPAPVISEGIFILGVQRSGRGKHDGGVQVSDDARNSAGRCDTGLGAFVPGLQRREHQRHLHRAACRDA